MAKQSKSAHGGGMAGHLVRRGIPVIVLLLALGGVSAYWIYTDTAPKPETAAPPQAPVAVNVVTVRKETVPVRVRFLGQTEASQIVELRARVAGYLEERTFKEGDKVEKGQKLFLIDPRPFQVKLAEANAGLASAEATLARARVQAARYAEAYAQRATSQQELEDWQTQARVAEAQVELQKSLIAAAQLQLGYTSIEAPITGMIGRALKDIGSYVDAGQNGLLAVVQQVDPMYVRYAITEQEMLRFDRQLAAGEIAVPALDEIELEITLADGTTYAHKGRINFVDVQVDETTGTSMVRGQVPNPDNMLKPGQFIHTNVLGIERVNVIRVPQRAVQQSPSGPSVLVANDEGVAENRPVTLGDWSGADDWVISSGLREGDRVIIDRLMMVRAGTPVTIAEPKPGTPGAPTATAPEPPTAERSDASSSAGKEE